MFSDLLLWLTMADPVTPAPAEPNARPTILVVEDEVRVRLAIAEFLRDCGYCVLEASDAEEAKALLDAGADVDLVFSDVQMPGRMDGFILASWVRQHHPGIELILTSGTASASDRARDLCQDGQVIPKPYDQQTVLNRSERLAARIPDSVLQIVRGAGHMVHYSVPEQVARAVESMDQTSRTRMVAEHARV